MTAMKRKSIFIPDELWEKCENEAKSTGETASEVLRRRLSSTFNVYTHYPEVADDNPTKQPIKIYKENR